MVTLTPRVRARLCLNGILDSAQLQFELVNTIETALAIVLSFTCTISVQLLQCSPPIETKKENPQSEFCCSAYNISTWACVTSEPDWQIFSAKPHSIAFQIMYMCIFILMFNNNYYTIVYLIDYYYFIIIIL